MNYQQLFTSSTPEEQLELIALMLHTIEARQNKRILVLSEVEGQIRCGLIRNRRGAFRGAHFLNDKRRRLTPRPAYLSTFMFALITMSIAVWVSFFNLPPTIAAPLMLAHLLTLTAILTIKPSRAAFILYPSSFILFPP